MTKSKITLTTFDLLDPNYPHDLMPPSKRTIIAPQGGWLQYSYYVVDVSFRSTNPVHRAIFYTGFLRDGEPDGNNSAWNPTWDDCRTPIGALHYLKPIGQIDMNTDGVIV